MIIDSAERFLFLLTQTYGLLSEENENLKIILNEFTGWHDELLVGYKLLKNMHHDPLINEYNFYQETYRSGIENFLFKLQERLN